jgi:hypothetical protein
MPGVNQSAAVTAASSGSGLAPTSWHATRYASPVTLGPLLWPTTSPLDGKAEATIRRTSGPSVCRAIAAFGNRVRYDKPGRAR